MTMLLGIPLAYKKYISVYTLSPYCITIYLFVSCTILIQFTFWSISVCVSVCVCVCCVMSEHLKSHFFRFVTFSLPLLFFVSQSPSSRVKYQWRSQENMVHTQQCVKSRTVDRLFWNSYGYGVSRRDKDEPVCRKYTINASRIVERRSIVYPDTRGDTVYNMSV